MSSLTFTSPDTARLPVRIICVKCPSQQSNNYCLLVDRLITAQDHASIQLQIADVDADGKAIRGSATTIAICGRIRAQGDSDDSINRIATKEGCEFLLNYAYKALH